MLDSREPGLQKMLDSGISCEPGLTGPAACPTEDEWCATEDDIAGSNQCFPCHLTLTTVDGSFFIQYALNFIKSNEIAANTFPDIQM